MSQRHGMFCIGLGVVLSGAFSLALGAQTPQTRQPPVFGVGVTLVAVPVFVTDKSGKGVGGLTVEDFEVEDGGKRVPVVAFQAIDVDAPVNAEAERAAAAELPLAVQAAAARQFMLLIDSRFSPTKGLYFGKEAAASYVRESLAPEDLVAVATTGAAGLRVHTNFTRDHKYVADVIGDISTGGMPGSDPLGFSSNGLSGGLGSMVSDPLDMGSGMSAGAGAGNKADAELEVQDALRAQADARGAQNSALGFLGDLEVLVHRLAPFRGRKQIVLFSGGFAEGLWLYSDGRGALLSKMKEIFRDAGRADVVINSVDLNGITEAIDLTGQASLNEIGRVSDRPQMPPSRESPGRGTLIALSLNTGGQAIRPGNDFKKAFGEVDRISRHSYVIAFEASEADGGNNRPRRLKVKLRRPGLTVSHRPEYSLATPRLASASDVQGQAREAIAKGLSGGPLRLRLTTLPYRDTAGKPSLNAVLQIGGTALADAAQGKEMAMQVYGYAMAAGRVLDGIAFNTSIDLSKFGTAVRSEGLSIVTAFPASSGDVDLRFFVRAGGSEVTGSIQRNVAVPAFAADERVLSAPMFPLPVGGQVVFPFQPKGRPQIKIPFYVGEDRFLPDAAVILKPGQPRDACVFVWRDREGTTVPFNVTAELVRPGQSPLPVRIQGAPRVVPDSDGFDRYVVSIVPPNAVAGDYALRLTFVEPLTGKTSHTETIVVIAS
jgi:VWFA-related protein